MEFKEIFNEQWVFIRLLLPYPAKESRPRADNRRMINAILYVLTTGCRWMDLPKKYGPKSTVHDRLKDWGKKGVWKRIFNTLISRKYVRGELSFDKVSIDSSDVAAKKGEMRLDTMVIRR